MADLQAIYKTRFSATGLKKRRAVWKVLCEHHFNKLVSRSASVLDIACGYGEFINNVNAGKKTAIDLNPDAKANLNSDVDFHRIAATQLDCFPENSFDVVFTSNFLEHLKSKDECDVVLGGVLARLKPGGRFIVMGPNIRFAYKEYWDYYDHYLPLSHVSLGEGLVLNGFELVSVVDRFLPYTMNNATPTYSWLIRLYLSLPVMWKIMGKQFLIVARKPDV